MRDDPRVVDRVSNRGTEVSLLEGAGPGRHFTLAYNGEAFRSTNDSAASAILAETMLGLIKSSRGIDILLGGLGLGDTLKTVLGHTGLRSVTVVEQDDIVPAWVRDHLQAGELLDDPKTHLVIGNFAGYLEGAPESYHGIALDLDLGPPRILREENRRAYSLTALRNLTARLRSDGVLVIRSTEDDRAYRRALDEIFSEVAVRTVDLENAAGHPVRTVIYVARM